MKHVITGILTLGLMLGAVAVTNAKPGKAAASKPSKMDGTIAEIDATARTVSVQGGIGAPLLFKLPASATIAVVGKRDAALSDLKVGDKVTVTYNATTTDLAVVKIAPVTEQKETSKKKKK